MKRSLSSETDSRSISHKLSLFLWNRAIHCRVHESPLTNCKLDHISTAHLLTIYILKSILILSSHINSDFPSDLFLSGSPIKCSSWVLWCGNMSTFRIYISWTRKVCYPLSLLILHCFTLNFWFKTVSLLDSAMKFNTTHAVVPQRTCPSYPRIILNWGIRTENNHLLAFHSMSLHKQPLQY